MAYRRAGGRSGGYRSARSSATRRPTYGGRGGSRRSFARVSSRKRVSSRSPQTVKIVLETRPSSAVSRPELSGTPMVETRSKRAKF